ncbi:hypothetical protein SAOR_08850 [Salinisphaera orenii MK-B5]|uniref:Uncharacterized protein n=1 Tax=Salinisphaera orenii MK-B5 TaxID=856730 RepID=A0A423PNZ4_9GAMM|nr:hypothetical protein [Salinisphaera orenii]ROO27297.1 hypothetical protein SAOR_08850 [Salinisphaera orenii MK-B5]
MRDDETVEHVTIKEKHGPLPRWAWLFIATCVIYGFVIGPFDWFSP